MTMVWENTNTRAPENLILERGEMWHPGAAFRHPGAAFRGTCAPRSVAPERRILTQNRAQVLATTFLLIISRGPDSAPRFWAQNRDHISSWF